MTNDISTSEKQEILEEFDIHSRLEKAGFNK